MLISNWHVTKRVKDFNQTKKKKKVAFRETIYLFTSRFDLNLLNI